MNNDFFSFNSDLIMICKHFKLLAHLRHVGKLSTITLITVAPPILDIATNTEDNPRILLVSSAQ